MTRDLPADFDVDYEVTRFVRKVRARTMSRLGEIHPKLDYGSFMFFLAICDAADGVRGSELAEQFGVHKSTASRAVASLDEMGLIRRAPDPDDGRAQRLVADPEAVQRLTDFRAAGHDWLASLLSDWSAEELSEFAGNLARLNDAAEHIPY